MALSLKMVMGVFFFTNHVPSNVAMDPFYASCARNGCVPLMKLLNFGYEFLAINYPINLNNNYENNIYNMQSV